MKKRAAFKRKVWTGKEDKKLRDYVRENEASCWETVARELGLGRSGNSCRLRWVNYLSPDITRGSFTDEEMLMILILHFQFGNKWSTIARQLPGRRTDNDIKNYWNTRVKNEAKHLNGGVECKNFQNGEVFLQIMTGILMEKIHGATQPPPLVDHGGHPTSTGCLMGPAIIENEAYLIAEASVGPTTVNPSFGGEDNVWSFDPAIDECIRRHFGFVTR